MKYISFYKDCLLLLAIILTGFSIANGQPEETLTNKKLDGYRGIWYELNQKHEYGDKNSGALGTCSAKHVPLAIYAKKVDKTFFVYGGTTNKEERHLLCMIGEYDHKTGVVSKPTVVYDKKGVDDPHDNPSIMIDDEGYILVFVSGRNTTRMGIKMKSKKPYDISEFEELSEEVFTYPQPWNMEQGYFHFFTKYTGVRQLYFETSVDGMKWTDDKLIAAIPVNEGEKSGHYQTSNIFENKVAGTFFNRHIDGHPDTRTDLYYIQTKDFGLTWTSVDGTVLELPLLQRESPARAIDYQTKGKNVYMKDIGFDAAGNPVCLYVRSNGFKPGPSNVPYEWCVTKWDGKNWKTFVVCESDHNYDMGSIYISDNEWKIVGPTEPGPQKWGAGGELAVWCSENKGESWNKIKQLTKNSINSHSYVRRPVNFKAPFCFFWADGHSHNFSKSELYFGDFEGNIWKLPYEMKEDYEKPIKIK